MANVIRNMTVIWNGGNPTIYLDGSPAQDPSFTVQSGDTLTLNFEIQADPEVAGFAFAQPPHVSWNPSKPSTVTWTSVSTTEQQIEVDNTNAGSNDITTSFTLWVTDGSSEISVLMGGGSSSGRARGVDPTIIEKADEGG